MIFMESDEQDEDFWDASRIDEASLFRRLDVGEKGLVCDFGKGKQGVVYMTQDGNFVKITRSRREAALAARLQHEPHPGFPRIDDVVRVEVEGVMLYAIYREGADDVIDEDTADEIVHELKWAWTDLTLLWPPKHHSRHVRSLQDLAPAVFENVYRLLGHLQDVSDFHGLEVRDIHIDNIGLTESGEFVVRDFGFNNLLPEAIDELVGRIRDLPETSGPLHTA